jgi:hypothetical protein
MLLASSTLKIRMRWVDDPVFFFFFPFLLSSFPFLPTSLPICILLFFPRKNSNGGLFQPTHVQRFVHAMRATQGAFIAGSALNIILGFSGIWGIAARHVSPIVIAPVTAIVGLGLLEYGFPGVCCLCAYLICENQHYQHHLLSVPSLLQLHCSSSIAVS